MLDGDRSKLCLSSIRDLGPCGCRFSALGQWRGLSVSNHYHVNLWLFGLQTCCELRIAVVTLG